MMQIVTLGVALLCFGALIACGDDATDSTGAASSGGSDDAGMRAKSRGADAAAGPRGPLVKLRDSQLGPVLFSGSDRALYVFTRDRQRASRCHGECAVAWPPFLARGRPRAGRGVKPALLGTIGRGGRQQVTYAGQPLYFYVDDPKGEVLCNDIVEFGGTWFALTSEGEPPV
jgi:predicted lipoprotein with Yx(FWY)xxD motif